jgi:hypothetical protein
LAIGFSESADTRQSPGEIHGSGAGVAALATCKTLIYKGFAESKEPTKPTATKVGYIGSNVVAFCAPVVENTVHQGANMSALELSQSEIRMLIQSLEHCLATCHNEKKGSSDVCPDCDAAKQLRQKLSTQLTA